jgi:hypothetical protein
MGSQIKCFPSAGSKLDGTIIVRWIAVVVAGILSWSTAQAQLSGAAGAAIMPSPLGIVLTVGKWIYDASTKKQVYYIEVVGQGSNSTEARDNGFKLAVEQAIGSLISSETEVQNGRIVRDEIISYASGFVDRFEITETRATGTGTLIFMRVWVKRSDLSDRLLNRSERSGEVDGARASVQLQTLNQERATGDRLLQQVLNDFPKRAFDIEMKPTDVVRQNRSAHMELTFVLGWNQDYLRSLWTALEATSQRSGRTVSTITVGPGGWFRGFGGQARFDDDQKWALLINRMVGERPAVLATVRGPRREVIFSACYNYQELDNLPQYVVNENRFVKYGAGTAQIIGGYQLKGRLQIPINPAQLHLASSVDLDVVLHKQCPNR